MAQRFTLNKAWGRIALLSLALFATNLHVCRELFRIEYLRQMGSIEGLFIALARYARDNWNDLGWFPLWYGGIPYQNTYPPLLPVVVAGVSAITGWSPALAYHVTVASVYCAAPVLLFWLCCRLSRSVVASFFAGLLYSVVASSAFLIADIHRDLGSVMRSRRLQTLIVYGEGPHLAGLAWLALSILLLDVAIEKRRPQYYVLAALSFSATALTNWLAAAALGIATVAYLLARGREALTRAALVCAGIAVLAYAFATPWIPPSTVRAFQFNSQTIGGDFRHYAQALPLRALLFTGLLAAAKLALSRLGASRTLQFGGYFALVTGALALLWEYGGIAVVPQPHRYHSEMELGIAVLLPFALQPVIRKLPRYYATAAVCLCLAAVVPFVRENRRYARWILQPENIAGRIEYKSARWMDANLRGQRVMVPGSIRLWTTVFYDIGQLGGADDQGTTNFLTRVAEYVITTGDATGERDVEISLTWLDAFGVNAIEVSGPRSQEVYKPFGNPSKFDGILKELWRDGDDVIYRVPQARMSLAHAMRRSDLPARVPVNGLDIDPLKPYVAALEDSSFPAADWRWTSRHSAEIHAELRPEHILSVQVSHHPGWHATVNRRPARIYADALGQIAIEPRCDGPCTVELVYDGGLEMRLARIACWLALAGSAAWVVAGNYRRRSASI